MNEKLVPDATPLSIRELFGIIDSIDVLHNKFVDRARQGRHAIHPNQLQRSWLSCYGALRDEDRARNHDGVQQLVRNLFVFLEILNLGDSRLVIAMDVFNQNGEGCGDIFFFLGCALLSNKLRLVTFQLREKSYNQFGCKLEKI